MRSALTAARERCAWWGATLVALFSLLAYAGCSTLLEREGAQCTTDDDCARFGSHPFCRSSVCVPSGFAPVQCVYPTPTAPLASPTDFLNQCSESYLPGAPGQCLAYTGPTSDAGLRDPSPVDVAALEDAGTGALEDASAAEDASAVEDASAADDAQRPIISDAGSSDVAAHDAEIALPPCRDEAAGRGSIVTITGSSNFPPLLDKLTGIIHGQTGRTPVFQLSSSCRAIHSIYTPSERYIKDPTPGTSEPYAQYYSEVSDGTTTRVVRTNCLLGPTALPLDIGESESFSETCGIPPNTKTVFELTGPSLAFVFAVPKASTAQVISAEAARDVFGGGGLSPWDDPNLFFIRGGGTATQLLVGLAIDVPASKFWGNDQGTAEALAKNMAALSTSALADKAIGLLGSEVYDRNRGTLRALAFQAKRQACAYTPDSNSNLSGVRDKINMRNGHYPIWGSFHFFAARENGSIASEAADQFVTLFPVQYPEDLLDAIIDTGLVPACAMAVKRTSELGDLQAISPSPYPCGCHFDYRLNGGRVPEGCTPCQVGENDSCTDLTLPTHDPQRLNCSYGFCEHFR
jgi:hypothetical protein